MPECVMWQMRPTRLFCSVQRCPFCSWVTLLYWGLWFYWYLSVVMSFVCLATKKILFLVSGSDANAFRSYLKEKLNSEAFNTSAVRFWGLGGWNAFLGGRYFCFCCMLKQIFLGTTKFRAAQKFGEELLPITPLATDWCSADVCLMGFTIVWNQCFCDSI